MLNPNAAGIDVASEEMWVCVPPDRAKEQESNVRKFGAFTCDLHAIAAWLSECGVTTVAMESTGIYWIPLYQVLENARVHRLPGERPPDEECVPVVPTRIGWIAGGFNACTPMGYSCHPFVPRMKAVTSARCSAIARRSFAEPPVISSICKKPCIR